LISNGKCDTPVKQVYVLLRQPGKNVTVLIDSADFKESNPEVAEVSIELIRQKRAEDLHNHVLNILQFLKRHRSTGKTG
jgi:hypothetical protein